MEESEGRQSDIPTHQRVGVALQDEISLKLNRCSLRDFVKKHIKDAPLLVITSFKHSSQSTVISNFVGIPWASRQPLRQNSARVQLISQRRDLPTVHIAQAPLPFQSTLDFVS